MLQWPHGKINSDSNPVDTVYQ